eukprot:scpid72752/ scgid17234/ 
MSTIYTHLHTKLVEWSTDSSDILDGTARPFPTAVVAMADPVLSCLLEKHSSDECTLEILQVLCTSFAIFTARLLADHLPGGRYHKPEAEVVEECVSVPNTNAISERDFAQLDRLLRQKPAASTIALDGMIAYANNRTAEWLNAKDEEEQASILANARRSAPAMRALFKERQKEIADCKVKVLQPEKGKKPLREKEILS